MRKILMLASILACFAGCMETDPEKSLYQSVRSVRTPDTPYKVYNCPCIYLTSKQQQYRSDLQAAAVSEYVAIGLSESALAQNWGRPNHIVNKDYPGVRYRTFVYESTGGRYMHRSSYYFVFRDRRLESWHRM